MNRKVPLIAIIAVFIIIGLLVTIAVVFVFPDKNDAAQIVQEPPTLETQEYPTAETPADGETAAADEAVPTLSAETMTLDQKVGQLFMVHFDGLGLDPTLRALITECQVGGIILFGPNIRDAEQIAALINESQQLATQTGASVPLFVAVDQEGWPIARLEQIVTTFPSNMAVSASNDSENARLIGLATGQELRALGLNMNFAPVLDVNTNPANPVIGLRSFGSDPQTVADFGTAMISGLQEAGVVPMAKHFPGHGDTSEDSHLTLPQVDKSLEELYAVDLVPFTAAISRGVPAIMSAHIVVQGLGDNLPATLSSEALTSLLREDLGFDGLIATDSMGMNAITSSYDGADAAIRALLAGADLLMYGNDPGQNPRVQLDICRQLKQQAEIDREVADRIDSSAQRIIDLKREIGLFDETTTIGGSSGQSESHADLALQVARDSITLIEENDSLPHTLQQERVLFIYPDLIDGLPKLASTFGGNLQLVPVSLDPIPDQITTAVSRATEVDKVVMVTYDAFVHPQQVALYQALQEFNPIIVAMGLPYDINALSDVPVYLASYGYAPSSQQAVLDVLFRQHQAAGVFPVDIE